ncbi:MAG: type I-E CRISPR-associated protein Cas7/Cse4/CasC [Proteobacteria bacterium]|nr:type I-E CRISPR-associated protein Cas7/Cse4/CasC [Pseudomonadota bacterium]
MAGTSRPHTLFLQYHTLTSYPAALLNRDDQGFAKRLPFGGATRTRVSSQCLKRHWRAFDGEHSLASVGGDRESVTRSVRSRETFERLVAAPLHKEGVAKDLAHAATEAVKEQVLGKSKKTKKAKQPVNDDAQEAKAGDDSGATLGTSQVTVLGRPEIEFFLSEARAIASDAGEAKQVAKIAKKRFSNDWGKNLLGLKRAAGLDAALFGRMVTSSKLARADAAVHVAHSFTVHAEHSETDYFSAMDDLSSGSDEGEQLGSGHIGNAELTSGLFYGYLVVDVPQLVSNLEGCEQSRWLDADRTLAAEVVCRLAQLVTRVSPGAKLGSTAPYAVAHLLLAEAGQSQPRTLANAFLKPVPPRPDLLANTYSALSRYVSDVDGVYALGNRRAIAALAATKELAALAPPGSLDSAAKFAARAVLEAP